MDAKAWSKLLGVREDVALRVALELRTNPPVNGGARRGPRRQPCSTVDLLVSAGLIVAVLVAALVLLGLAPGLEALTDGLSDYYARLAESVAAMLLRSGLLGAVLKIVGSTALLYNGLLKHLVQWVREFCEAPEAEAKALAILKIAGALAVKGPVADALSRR